MLSVWLPLNGDLRNQGLSNITATNNGATVDNNGKIGKCYSFDGNDDFINLGNIGSHFNGSAFSICFWIFSLENKTRAAVFSSYGLSSTLNFFGLELNSSNNNYCNNNLRFDWLGSDTYSPDDFVTYNAWTHICVTYDGVNQIKMYKNGELIQTSTRVLNAIPVGNTYYLGRDSRTGSIAFSGKLNDFRIYDHCLSPRECKQVSTALVLHYTLSGVGNSNLINKLYQANRTVLNGRTITALFSQNLDTYFHFSCSETVTAGIDYTLSMDCSGFSDDTKYVTFGIVSQNSGKYITLRNGHCSSTFQFNSDIAANTKIILDDNNRATSGYTDITITNIKLEKGIIATPWLPNSADPEYVALGLNDGIEYDVSGYKYNGTKNGSFSYSSDTPRYNISTSFNGSAYISCTSPTDQLRSISFWINTPKTNSTVAFSDLKSKLGFGFNASGYIIPNCNNTATNEISMYSASSITANEWCHIVLVRDDSFSDVLVYINGVLQTSRASKNYWTHSTDTLMIGKRSTGNGMACLISDFRAYATELTEEEILELYHTPISLSSNGTLLTQGEYVES